MSLRQRHRLDEHLPMVLADLHRASAVGDVFELALATDRSPDDTVAVVTAAGFGAEDVVVDGHDVHVTAVRARTLPDFVGAGMRLLICGLNPSLYAADRGVNYARPGNRFWPALLAAGLASVDRDPAHALRHHRLGMTDLVKRATVAAAELDASEYAAGVDRVTRLCRWLRPSALCMVGLAGWRAAVDRRASPGPQPGDLGGVPVYLMPSTSGLNASTQHDGFTAHLRAAAGLAS